MSAKGVVFVLLMLLCGSAFAQQTAPVSAAVDAGGRDPTKNVLDKVNDVEKRLDDLRAVDRAMDELRYNSLKENVALRAEYEGKSTALRADYEDKIRKGESARLDAIRLVDTTNLSVDRERAAATAQALQKKGDDSALVLSAAVVKSADDVRNTVKTTADEQARNLATQLGGIQAQFTDMGKRLTSLEQTGAEGLGKTKYQDPQQAQILAALQATVAKLNEKNDTTTGAGIGRGEIVAYAISAIMLLLAVLQYMSRVSVPPASISPIFKPRGARVSSKTQ